MTRFASLLIANRSEIALRIQRTARRMGLRSIAVYSEGDRDARHAREADLAVCIGPAAPRASYLSIDALLDAARRTGAEAVHPGYGFLAESADFAQAVIDAGLVWVGPPPAAIRAMGDKANAKQLAGRRARGPRVRRHRPVCGRADARRATGRLSADDQGCRGRRRTRHAPGT